MTKERYLYFLTFMDSNIFWKYFWFYYIIFSYFLSLVVLEIVLDAGVLGDVAPAGAARPALQRDLQLLQVLVHVIRLVLVVAGLGHVGLHRHLHTTHNIDVH